MLVVKYFSIDGSRAEFTIFDLSEVKNYLPPNNGIVWVYDGSKRIYDCTVLYGKIHKENLYNF